MLLSFTCAVFCVFLLMGFILSYGCIPVYTRLLMNLYAVSTLGPPCIKAAVNLCMQYSFASGFFFFFFNVYNVVLVSTIQQCKSAIIILTSPPPPTPPGHHRSPDGALCATQHLLTSSPSCP